ncbi:rCG29974 [Rattus norvegicus]|uniref:RCG29974 n=1 Tax=Rattus norvegicus TaxID=10116 RepID=A6IN47_RAT|nr:rCG29974 [Rattus norvegicus]
MKSDYQCVTLTKSDYQCVCLLYQFPRILSPRTGCYFAHSTSSV